MWLYIREAYPQALQKRQSKVISSYSRCAKWKIVVVWQLNYCHLVFLFHTKELSNHRNGLHEKALRITYHDKISLFVYLLKNSKSVSIHHRKELLFKYLINWWKRTIISSGRSSKFLGCQTFRFLWQKFFSITKSFSRIIKRLKY